MSLEPLDEINSAMEWRSKAFQRSSTPISDAELKIDHQEERVQRRSSDRSNVTEYEYRLFIHYMNFPTKAEPFKVRGIRTAALPDNSLISGFLQKGIVIGKKVPRNRITRSHKTYNIGWAVVPYWSAYYYSYQNAPPRLVIQQNFLPSIQYVVDTSYYLQYTCHLAQNNYCTQHSHACTCAYQQFCSKFQQYFALHYIQPNLYALQPQQRCVTPQGTYCPCTRSVVPLQTINNQVPSTWIRYPGVHHVAAIEQSGEMPLESP